MKILSVRSGFANNSSSSHSVVLHSELDEFYDDNGYGWEEFILRSPKAKSRYFSSQVYVNLRQQIGEEVARHATTGMFGEPPAEEGGVIDHQSVWDLPMSFGEKSLSIPFITEFHQYLLKPEVSIAGGNDNSRSPYDYGKIDKTVSNLPRDGMGRGLICRKDGEFWTLFNRTNGEKIRLSFTSKEPWTGSSTPELVDFKITDFCPFGCEFCYQGSTPKGQHAPVGTVRNFLYDLKDMNVFEVALGGGEPTMHPEFPEILKVGDSNGICMNFTTFTTNWTKNRKVERAVLNHCSAFAVSVTDKNRDVIRKVATWKSLADYKGQVSVQIILELLTSEQITSIIKDLKKYQLTHLTLLGHKSCGRANGEPEKINQELLAHAIDSAKKFYLTLSVDSVIVDRYRENLRGLGVSDLLMTDRDGRFSMYVDAVTSTISANSYGSKLIPIKHPQNWSCGLSHTISEHFPFGKTQDG